MKFLLIFLLFTEFTGKNKCQKAYCKFVDYKYVSYTYSDTYNKSFINKAMLFVKNDDTLTLNQKLPFDQKTKNTFNPGVYYNCHLEIGNVYTFCLQKIPLTDVPVEYNNYYRSNAVFADESNTFRFTEVEKDTEFNYRGDYTKYFDIKKEIFKIIELSPMANCSFQH